MTIDTKSCKSAEEIRNNVSAAMRSFIVVKVIKLREGKRALLLREVYRNLKRESLAFLADCPRFMKSPVFDMFRILKMLVVPDLLKMLTSDVINMRKAAILT